MFARKTSLTSLNNIPIELGITENDVRNANQHFIPQHGRSADDGEDVVLNNANVPLANDGRVNQSNVEVKYSEVNKVIVK